MAGYPRKSYKPPPRYSPGRLKGRSPVPGMSNRSVDRRSNLQPFLADRLVGFKCGRRAFEHDAAMAHDIEAVRKTHRDRKFLLHQQGGDATAGEFRQEVAHRVPTDG